MEWRDVPDWVKHVLWGALVVVAWVIGHAIVITIWKPQ